MCRAAAEEGIFCRGFRRWPEREFHDRWKGHIGTSSHLTRSQMEELADFWQLSEQIFRRDALVCDAVARTPGGCRGWDEFTNGELEGFCRELLGLEVAVSSQSDQIEHLLEGEDFTLTPVGIKALASREISRETPVRRGEVGS